MKLLLIPAKSKAKTNKRKIESISRELPKNIAIAYSIQFEEIAKEIKKILSKNHKVTALTQVLGCSRPRVPKSTNAVLLIGSGKFHAISLSFETGLPIYILNKDSLERVSEKDSDILEKRHKTSYLKFLNAERVGILVSLKPGQERLKKAIKLKGKIKNKKSYLFLANNINTDEFENYKLSSWINTACPRLDMDARVINEGDLK